MVSDKPTLSIAIITLNEERNIGDCLASVSDIADEIIVLDSFSADSTESICRQYPKVIFSQHAFDGYITQRNRAMSKCSGEWVLIVDADERVTPELRKSIEDFIARNPVENGARFPRLTFHMKKFIRHSSWYPNARCRLIRKGKGRWGGESPHEKLLVDGKMADLKGDLLHFSFRDLSDQVATINAFSSLAALSRFNKGRLFSLGRLFFKPISKFLEIFLFKRGFLDGIQGWIIAISSSYSTFLKEAKLFELDRLGSDKPSNLSPKFEKTLNVKRK